MLQTQHFWLDQIFETKLFEICTIIYIVTKSYIIVNLWYQNLKFDKTYLPIKSIFSLSNPWSSKHRSGTLSNSTTVRHGDYAVDTLKVEIEAVKDRKTRFSHSHHNLLLFLVRCMSPQYWSSSRIASKRCFTWILLSHFHFLVSFIWFLSFSYCTKRPHIFFDP